MATLKVRQFKDDVWVSDDRGKEILEARRIGKEPKFYTFGTLQIPATDIRTVTMDGHKSTPQDTGQFRYDLNTLEHQAIIKGFEGELNGRDIEQYLYEEKIVVRQRPPYEKFGYAIVYERAGDFSAVMKKWSGLQDWRGRRFYAEKMEHQSQFSGVCPEERCKYCTSWFDRNRELLGRKLSGEEVKLEPIQPGEVMPELPADMVDDEISVKDIPF